LVFSQLCVTVLFGNRRLLDVLRYFKVGTELHFPRPISHGFHVHFGHTLIFNFCFTALLFN